jgi:hypothetical protein
VKYPALAVKHQDGLLARLVEGTVEINPQPNPFIPSTQKIQRMGKDTSMIGHIRELARLSLTPLPRTPPTTTTFLAGGSTCRSFLRLDLSTSSPYEDSTTRQPFIEIARSPCRAAQCTRGMKENSASDSTFAWRMEHETTGVVNGAWNTRGTLHASIAQWNPCPCRSAGRREQRIAALL